MVNIIPTFNTTGFAQSMNSLASGAGEVVRFAARSLPGVGALELVRFLPDLFGKDGREKTARASREATQQGFFSAALKKFDSLFMKTASDGVPPDTPRSVASERSEGGGTRADFAPPYLLTEDLESQLLTGLKDAQVSLTDEEKSRVHAVADLFAKAINHVEANRQKENWSISRGEREDLDGLVRAFIKGGLHEDCDLDVLKDMLDRKFVGKALYPANKFLKLLDEEGRCRVLGFKQNLENTEMTMTAEAHEALKGGETTINTFLRGDGDDIRAAFSVAALYGGSHFRSTAAGLATAMSLEDDGTKGITSKQFEAGMKHIFGINNDQTLDVAAEGVPDEYCKLLAATKQAVMKGALNAAIEDRSLRVSDAQVEDLVSKAMINMVFLRALTPAITEARSMGEHPVAIDMKLAAFIVDLQRAGNGAVDKDPPKKEILTKWHEISQRYTAALVKRGDRLLAASA